MGELRNQKNELRAELLERRRNITHEDRMNMFLGKGRLWDDKRKQA